MKEAPIKYILESSIVSNKKRKKKTQIEKSQHKRMKPNLASNFYL